MAFTKRTRRMGNQAKTARQIEHAESVRYWFEKASAANMTLAATASMLRMNRVPAPSGTPEAWKPETVRRIKAILFPPTGDRTPDLFG